MRATGWHQLRILLAVSPRANADAATNASTRLSMAAAKSPAGKNYKPIRGSAVARGWTSRLNNRQ
jgi:hypothetical protein